MKNVQTIDASGKSLGRLASDISMLLRGKTKADFSFHQDGGNFVVVKNVDLIKISGRKLQTKIYHHYTGYVGSMKSATMAQVIAKKGIGEILRRAVWGMLPANKLRKQTIKRLKIIQ